MVSCFRADLSGGLFRRWLLSSFGEVYCRCASIASWWRIQLFFCIFRCREKQRKEATRLVSVNAKLTALNKLLMEENERLAKHTSQLTLENHALRQQLPNQPFPDGRHRLSSQASACCSQTINVCSCRFRYLMRLLLLFSESFKEGRGSQWWR